MGRHRADTRSAAAFHRREVEDLKREIEGVDRNSKRKYIREYHRAYRTFRDLSSWDDLVHDSVRSDLVFIVDYHALPASQDLAARLLGEIAGRTGKTILAMEMVFGRHQRILDRWLAGGIEEEEFLTRIRYQQEWGYPWEGFRGIFAVAREHGLPVFGIDCEPRNGLRYIRRRDRYAAGRLADLITRHPGARVVVVIGESHLAPEHLPARVEAELARRAGGGPDRGGRPADIRSTLVLQNVESIYWKLADQGHEQNEVVSLGPGQYCVFTASPLAKYESYRQTIDRWKADPGDGDEVDLTPTIYRMIDTLLKFLGVDKFGACVDHDSECIEYLVDVYPEVYAAADAPVFRRLLRRAGVSKAETARIERRVRAHGSFYVPAINAVLVGTFNLVHGGEEATHFVNFALKGELLDRAARRRERHDQFYITVLEEALGFFGSKLFVPSRNHFFENDLYKFYRKDPEMIAKQTPYSEAELNEIVHFVLLHKKFEVSYQDYDDIPPELLAGVHARGQRFRILTHELGYYLGQQLYDGLERGLLARDEITRLFRATFATSGTALRTYLDLTEKLKSLRE